VCAHHACLALTALFVLFAGFATSGIVSALALLFTGLPVSFAFDSGGLRFFMLRDAPLVSSISLAAALALWLAFGVVTRRLRVTGL
jgi:hypothetical protein